MGALLQAGPGLHISLPSPSPLYCAGQQVGSDKHGNYLTLYPVKSVKASIKIYVEVRQILDMERGEEICE